MEPAASVPETAPPEPKKSWFEMVVTSTPVLLTVIATFLIGQSTGEMTRAQYFRAVASQNQSKVGDQWGFFQAKRIRGQILEGNADMLLAQKRTPFSRDTILLAAQGMVTELKAAEKAMAADGKNGKGAVWADADRDLKALIAEAEESLARAKAALNPPGDGWQGERVRLDAKNVQAALAALQPKPKKKSKAAYDAKDLKAPAESEASKNTLDAEQILLLKEIIAGIKTRKPESELAPNVLKLKDETLNQAITESDRRADEFYQRGKNIENVLEEFDALVDRQTSLTFEFQQLAARQRPNTDALDRQVDAIRDLNAQLQGDYKAARHAFSSRRYEGDARSNQESAYLYEVRVLLSSARSDKHLFRSKMFLFAMLVAQAGVTIATLALAVKRKSVFWLLAALTGVIAIGFGTYVYLDLGPLPTF